MTEIYSRLRMLKEAKSSIENRFHPYKFPDGVENLKAGDKIDLSPQQSGEVIKEVRKLGDGTDYPNEGDKCEVKYTGYVGEIADDKVFDSSEKDGKNFVFEVARGKVVKGFELAISTMTVGERAIVSMHPDFAFGRGGKPPTIPPNTWIIFDTEIVCIEEEDYSKDQDRSMTKKVMRRGTGWTYPNTGGMVDIHIKGWYHDKNKIEVFEDRDVKFPMGEGIHPDYSVPEYIEYFLKDMKKTEISRFRVASKHCYGEKGCPRLKIPPNKDLTFQIHQKNFERVKDIWEMNNAEKLDQCAMFKDKGNDYFKKQLYDLAAIMYERILFNLEYNHIFFGDDARRQAELMLPARLNMAQVCLKQKKFDKVREYCDKALRLDKNNVKGFYRRGMANFEMKNFEEAKKDFEHVLELEPENADANKKIGLCAKNMKTYLSEEKLLAKNMMSMIGKGGGGDLGYGSGMNDITDWSNDMAEGMMTIDQESEAFDLGPVKGVEQG